MIVARITCENPEDCQRIAEVQEELMAQYFEPAVFLVVMAAVVLCLYQIHTRGGTDAE